ncbi:diacylglycerol lipase-beta-like [Dioscorea cayenensis subsp. rotundata]|uniref:Diacylglycerol lipase-beta-like n=1 Tax=Dioscorea cayennensis subsp. rotundata TaxID=55577 RepID=A0AB40BNQ2_DIOCR|nr:diacylglycerol lipase-beta-like [Dioscorea cayenensis subsp. rotundata]
MCLPASAKDTAEEEGGEEGGDRRKEVAAMERGRRRMPDRAPETRMEAVAMSALTVRFVWAETMGKWPLADLLIGVRYLSGRQGNSGILPCLNTGVNFIELKGPEVIAELAHQLKLLTLCTLFTAKKFPKFLKSAGYSQQQVLQKSKPGFLRPYFTILHDESNKCIVVLIRGARSFKDRLTAATAAVVPFHHLVIQEGNLCNLVLGHAHCGMLAAARWIAKSVTPCLLRVISQNPDYHIKIIGHSLGGGIAAILSYILREREEFSSSSCIAFSSAACMTWDLADSSKCFVTSIVNNSDVVPTLSTVSVDNLRSEIAKSSWLKKFWGQFRITRLLSEFCCSTFGSCIPFISTKEEKAVMKHEQNGVQTAVQNDSCVCCTSCINSWHCTKVYDTHHIGSTVPRYNKETSIDETSLSDSSASYQLYPPGRIIHMVTKQEQDTNSTSDSITTDEFFGIYETPRCMYGKVFLSQNMIHDHYMPAYVKTMEQLINRSQKMMVDVVSADIIV